MKKMNQKERIEAMMRAAELAPVLAAIALRMYDHPWVAWKALKLAAAIIAYTWDKPDSPLEKSVRRLVPELGEHLKDILGRSLAAEKHAQKEANKELN